MNFFSDELIGSIESKLVDDSYINNITNSLFSNLSQIRKRKLNYQIVGGSSLQKNTLSVDAVISLISEYAVSSLVDINKYDEKIINVLDNKTNANNEACVSILLASTSDEVINILYSHNIVSPLIINEIISLKKLSAYDKYVGRFTPKQKNNLFFN